MPINDVVDALVPSDLVDDPTRNPAAEPRRAARTAKLRRHWARRALLTSVTLGAIGGFLAISRVASKRNGSRIDRTIMKQVGRVRGPIATAIVKGITSVGSAPGAVAITIAAMGLVRQRPRLMAQIAVGALGGVSAELWIKRLFRRERPNLVPHLEHVSSTSFPSGHSMASSALYLTLAFVLARGKRRRSQRVAAFATAGALASSIAATRVYLGVHWPTDVVGGLALGTAWACMTEAGFDFSAAEQLESLAAEPELR